MSGPNKHPTYPKYCDECGHALEKSIKKVPGRFNTQTGDQYIQVETTYECPYTHFSAMHYRKVFVNEEIRKRRKI